MIKYVVGVDNILLNALTRLYIKTEQSKVLVWENNTLDCNKMT